jgi:hypothetical protein
LDYKNPDYAAIFVERAERLSKLRSDPELLAAYRIHYRNCPADFISDWGMTFDPRNLERGLLANMPFILWPKQVEYIEWLHDRWSGGERGIVEKSRDCGVTWLSVGFAVAMWCFHDGVAIGFGSRKEALVDKLGDPDSIFEKVRHFVSGIPEEFLPRGFKPSVHSTFMRMLSPETGSSITGEAGNNIGRGGRKSIYFVDEAAFHEQQDSVDKALSQSTNCQIDVSTFNGNGNAFYRKWKRFQGTKRHFIFDWRDDPRKDDVWYQRQKEEQDETTVAQEIDRDPDASNVDAFIPAKWVKAAIDAHLKLGFPCSGMRVCGFDPADTGDAKGVVLRHGSVVEEAVQLKNGDVTTAVPWAFSLADKYRCDHFAYDGDGLGSPVIKTYLVGASVSMELLEYRGSGEVEDPKKDYDGKRTRGKSNKDTFANYRAQSWTWVRDRFEATYHAVRRADEGLLVNVDPEKLISISSECDQLHELTGEISRPQRKWTNNGKIIVESKKDMKSRGVSSPNLADALVISFATRKKRDRRPRNYIHHRIRDRKMGY